MMRRKRLLTGEASPSFHGYDPLGNLVSTNQSGLARTFTYDSLSRLRYATTPESGTVSYNYDDAGNLHTQTDARNITATNSYDSLNRIKGTTYNDGVTPAVTYNCGCAGCAGNTAGHLVEVDNTLSYTYYKSFDPMGRVTASSQQIPGVGSYTFSNYSYNLAGALTGVTLPSGRVLTMNYDAANRVQSLQGVLNGATTGYVTGATYNLDGTPSTYTRGNGLQSNWYYNGRQQPVESYEAFGDLNHSLLTNCWFWGTQNDAPENGNCGASALAPNNGRLQIGYFSIATSGPAAPPTLLGFVKSYQYDNRNRLTQVTDSGNASRTMTYDAWGNMATTNAGVALNSLTPTYLGAYVNPNTNQVDNRIHLPGFQYDNAGNLTQMGTIGLTYDASNHQLSSSDSATGAQVSYSYDGLGQRVQKSVTGGATTTYIYDAFGQLAEEYSTQPQASPCATCYPSYDYLGSVQMVTDGSGHVLSRHDYYPYGEEITGGYRSQPYGPFGASDGASQRFTSQTRDSENAPPLDYFNARYYAGVLGRFMSPDPGGAGVDISNPQSWNAYSYALNNPLNAVDPSGLACVTLTSGGTSFTGDDGQGDLCPGSTNPDIINVFDTGSGITTAVGFDPSQTSQTTTSVVVNPAKSGTPNYCAFQGTALSPQQYAAQGKSFATGIAALSQSYAPDVAFSFGLGTLYGQFSKGSILDAQPRATGSPLQRASYGNYAFGAFFAGAGVPLSDALTAANTYGFKQQALGGAYQGRNMDRTYTHLPAVNVQDIVNGYNAALGGTMCHR